MSEVPIMVMPWHRPDPCKPLKMQTDAAFKSNYIDYLSSLDLDSPPLSTPLTSIVCTIGTSRNNPDMMIDLMREGMRMALVPLALGVRQDHVDTITNLRAANTAYSQIMNRVYPLGIAVQTKGPGLRIGGLHRDVPIELIIHHKITLSTDKSWRLRGTENYLYVGFPEMCHVLTKGDVLLLGYGTVILKVELVDENEVSCVVAAGGVIQSFMSLSIPEVPLQLPPLTDEDQDDLRLAASLGVDVVVASHTENAQLIYDLRHLLSKEDEGAGMKIWAQIESKQGLNNLESILEVADAVLLSRVSLTRDVAPEKLFIAQKSVIASCNKVGVPVYVSSHFLPSMQVDVAPPIPELNDVAAAVLDGADGFVLRNTTAIGKHPEQTVRTLSRLCVEAEAAVWHHQTFNYLNSNAPPPVDPTHAIAISAVEASMKTTAVAILLATTSGRSAQLVARYRPRCPIIAVTRYGQVARQLNTWRAIIPLHYIDPPLPDWTREVDVRLQFGIEFAKGRGIVNPGDTLVLLNGWRQGAGFTNTIRVVYASASFPWVYPHNLPEEPIEDNPSIPSLKTSGEGDHSSHLKEEESSKSAHNSVNGTSRSNKSLTAPKASKLSKAIGFDETSKPRQEQLSKEFLKSQSLEMTRSNLAKLSTEVNLSRDSPRITTTSSHKTSSVEKTSEQMKPSVLPIQNDVIEEENPAENN